MGTPYRFRKLTAHGPRDSRRPIDAYSADSALFDAADAIAGAVQDVSAEEGAAGHADLERMLRARELMPSDLVFEDGRWCSFEDAHAFAEVCEGLVDLRKVKGTLRAALVFFAALLLYAAITAFELWRG